VGVRVGINGFGRMSHRQEATFRRRLTPSPIVAFRQAMRRSGSQARLSTPWGAFCAPRAVRSTLRKMCASLYRS